MLSKVSIIWLCSMEETETAYCISNSEGYIPLIPGETERFLNFTVNFAFCFIFLK